VINCIHHVIDIAQCKEATIEQIDDALVELDKRHRDTPGSVRVDIYMRLKKSLTTLRQKKLKSK